MTFVVRLPRPNFGGVMQKTVSDCPICMKSGSVFNGLRVTIRVTNCIIDENGLFAF